MAELTGYIHSDGISPLYEDGTVPAVALTNSDIIQIRSKIYKNAFRDTYLAGKPLLNAIRTSTTAQGKFTMAAVTDGNEGEFSITFDHPNATDARAPQMLKLLCQLARQVGGRIVGAQSKTVYVTTKQAQDWADLAETTLAFNT